MMQGNYTSLWDAFPQLINLTAGTTAYDRVGGQNFTNCCLLAVNESLSVVNGFIVANTPSFIKSTVDELLSATADSQFPCTAAWNGNISGAPVVEVPSSWLEQRCPGWQISSSIIQSQWITPFIGFLLPAIVFCLSVPRRRKVTIYKSLFSLDISRPKNWIFAPVDMILAWLSAIFDTILWLAMCFAFAGPMLMSGLCEAYLDHLLVRFIQQQTKARKLTLDMRVRLLFVLVCGNLDLSPDHDPLFILLLDQQDQTDNQRWPNYRRDPLSGPFNNGSAWTHIEYAIHPLRSLRDNALLTPRQWQMHDKDCEIPNCESPYCFETPIPRTPATTRLIGQMKTALHNMLACQLSFGATVGAPVVFYLGTFVFTIVATLTSLGDHDTSIEIAFGMWFMLLPHIAIVSGLLLAGNNPNTLEGVLAYAVGAVENVYSNAELRNPLNAWFELAYQSRYRPQWLWFRGRSKRDWIRRVCTDYYDYPKPCARLWIDNKGVKDLRKETTMGFKGWAIVLGLTLLLLETPYILAFLTAFYTPKVGVSCRSLTFTLHAIVQLCMMCLWFWAWGGVPETCPKYLAFMRQNSWLEKSGFFTPTAGYLAWRDPRTIFTMRSFWAVLWFGAATILGLSSVFISIGGTLMQLIGVYRSDFCDINVPWWTKPHGNVPVVLSTNSALDIIDAKKYWMSTGITATAFLGVVCFCGWWYQRRLRGLFQDLVNDLGNEKSDRRDILRQYVRLERGPSVRISMP